MIEGALYPIPTLNGTLSGGVRTVIVSPEGEVFLTEPQKEYLKSLILMPGDPLTITYDMSYREHHTDHAEIDNNTSTIDLGESYSATVTSYDKRRRLNVTVLMGGVDVTNAFTTRTSFNTVVISIPNVTGNIKITAGTEAYASGLYVSYNASEASSDGFKIYENTDLDDLRPYMSVSLIVNESLEEHTTVRIPITDYTITGDLTLPDDGTYSGYATLTVYWNQRQATSKNVRVKVWRVT